MLVITPGGALESFMTLVAIIVCALVTIYHNIFGVGFSQDKGKDDEEQLAEYVLDSSPNLMLQAYLMD